MIANPIDFTKDHTLADAVFNGSIQNFRLACG